MQYTMIYILLLLAVVLSSVTSETLRQQSSQYEKEEQYEILPSSAILDRLQKLVANYPNFATLTTTQEWFGLPRAGKYIYGMFLERSMYGIVGWFGFYSYYDSCTYYYITYLVILSINCYILINYRQ